MKNKGTEAPAEMQEIQKQHNLILKCQTACLLIRDHDHKIVLKEGITPVNVRPYRYAASQNDEIEKMITEMLET